MSRLRNNLEAAKRDYESTRYRGNLALDVLGRDAAGPMSIAPAPRRNFAPLAIAAALAIGLGVGIFAGRASRSTATPEVATTMPAAIPALPTTTPTTPSPTSSKTVVASNDAATTPPATADEDFTVVPTAASFADQAVSIVPNLAGLEAAANDSANDSASATNAAPNSNEAVATAPMSLLLLSMDEYSAQQAAAEAKSTSGSQNTSTSEDRS